MDYYLLEHPTAMPVAEAAMTHVLGAPAPVLTLVPAQGDAGTTIQEQVAALRSA